MRVDSVGVAVPSRRITNDDILDLLTEHSPATPPELLRVYRKVVECLLSRAGSMVRYVRDLAASESAGDLVVTAMEDALRTADMRANDIDLVIYCGVGRGFLEPANAYFFAQRLGMRSACFDIVDACLSWVRSLELSYELLRGGRYQHIMVVNGEFNTQHGYPDNFRVRSVEQIEYTFPTYTIGEAATATVLSCSSATWRFAYQSFPDLADLCAIPLPGYENFVEPNGRLGRNGMNQLTAYGRELLDGARKHLMSVLSEVVDDLLEPDIYIPHVATDAIRFAASCASEVPAEKIYNGIFPHYGNVVSASIPMGIRMALSEGRLRRGDDVVLCPASAGMAFGAARFTY